MFLNDLIEFITDDASVNAQLNGGIIFDHLETNFDANKEWIVFNYSANGGTDVKGLKNAVEEYSLSAQIISKSIAKIDTISTLLNAHLTAYPNEWEMDISISDDNLDWSPEKEVYFKTIKYNILY